MAAGIDPDGRHEAFSETALRAAAAELRRSCLTCQHFNIEALTPARCYAPDQWIVVPQDGRGYCRHKWAAKEEV
jgi:sarcosine oxidase gamma subunit